MTNYASAVLDGEVVALDSLPLASFADGFFFGCGLFETLALTDEGPQFLERHLARLRRGLEALPVIVAPRPSLLEQGAVRASLERAAQGGERRPGVVKITSSDGHVLMTFRDGPPELARRYREGLSIDIIDGVTYRSGDRYANHKTISYIKSYASLGAASLFANELKEVCESPTANLFVRFADRIATPPVASPCLPGIIREVILEAGSLDGLPLVEEPVPVAALARATGAFLTSSLSIAVPVVRLLGRPLLDSASLAARARAAVASFER